MIIEEYPYTNEYGVSNNNLVHYYSDKKLKIRQVETGDIYDDVVDTYPSRYTYEEIDEPIETLTEEEVE